MSKSGAPEKKPTESHAPAAPTASKGAKHNVAPGGCAAVGCKSGEKRFSFCEEHYEQFKFGLIKKTGELVSDHEKKYEHYVAFRAKQAGARKKTA